MMPANTTPRNIRNGNGTGARKNELSETVESRANAIPLCEIRYERGKLL